jgi:hypothetical protein
MWSFRTLLIGLTSKSFWCSCHWYVFSPVWLGHHGGLWTPKFRILSSYSMCSSMCSLLLTPSCAQAPILTVFRQQQNIASSQDSPQGVLSQCCQVLSALPLLLQQTSRTRMAMTTMKTTIGNLFVGHSILPIIFIFVSIHNFGLISLPFLFCPPAPHQCKACHIGTPFQCRWSHLKHLSRSKAYPEKGREGHLPGIDGRRMCGGHNHGQLMGAVWRGPKRERGLQNGLGQVLKLVSAGFTTISDLSTLCTSLIQDVFNLHMLEMKEDGFVDRAWHKHLEQNIDINYNASIDLNNDESTQLSPKDMEVYSFFISE